MGPLKLCKVSCIYFFNGFPPNLYFSSHTPTQTDWSLNFPSGMGEDVKPDGLTRCPEYFPATPPYKCADKLKSPVTMGKVGQMRTNISANTNCNGI